MRIRAASQEQLTSHTIHFSTFCSRKQFHIREEGFGEQGPHSHVCACAFIREMGEVKLFGSLIKGLRKYSLEL